MQHKNDFLILSYSGLWHRVAW